MQPKEGIPPFYSKEYLVVDKKICWVTITETNCFVLKLQIKITKKNKVQRKMNADYKKCICTLSNQKLYRPNTKKKKQQLRNCVLVFNNLIIFTSYDTVTAMEGEFYFL